MTTPRCLKPGRILIVCLSAFVEEMYILKNTSLSCAQDERFRDGTQESVTGASAEAQVPRRTIPAYHQHTVIHLQSRYLGYI